MENVIQKAPLSVCIRMLLFFFSVFAFSSNSISSLSHWNVSLDSQTYWDGRKKKYSTPHTFEKKRVRERCRYFCVGILVRNTAVWYCMCDNYITTIQTCFVRFTDTYRTCVGNEAAHDPCAIQFIFILHEYTTYQTCTHTYLYAKYREKNIYIYTTEKRMPFL